MRETRLQTHAEIEGSGLWLLSVQRIAEAHGCEAYIEGYADGTPGSDTFSMARGVYPGMLSSSYEAIFVTTCPFDFAV